MSCGNLESMYQSRQTQDHRCSLNQIESIFIKINGQFTSRPSELNRTSLLRATAESDNSVIKFNLNSSSLGDKRVNLSAPKCISSEIRQKRQKLK